MQNRVYTLTETSTLTYVPATKTLFYKNTGKDTKLTIIPIDETREVSLQSNKLYLNTPYCGYNICSDPHYYTLKELFNLISSIVEEGLSHDTKSLE